MNAKEIREKNASYGDGLKEAGNVDNGEFIIKAAALEMLVEVAAQLAEVKEFLKIYSNPPMVFKGTDIDPAALDDALQNLPQGILTVMEPRLTLRDRFAMAVMPTVIERAREYNSSFSSVMTLGGHTLTEEDLERMVKEEKETRGLMVNEAYKWADKMLEARK